MQPEKIQTKIYDIRGQEVMLDFDLAELYETETKYLQRSARANIKRFPFVFMRQYALTNKDLTEKLHELENKYDKQFKDVYEAIGFLLQKDNQETEQKQRKRIGFKSDETN